MRIILLSAALAMALFATACSGGTLGTDDTSSILRIETSAGVLIASGDNRGSVTMDVGDQRTFRIIRVVTNDHSPTETTDVTADADFNFGNTSVASMDLNGVLTALASGFTTLEVIYRDGDGDPTDDDTVNLDITVMP